MSKPAPAAAAVLLMLTATLVAWPVWSRTDGKICELSHVERDRTNSSRCLGCHDGSVASAVHAALPTTGRAPESARARNLSGLRLDGFGGSHPIDFDYGSASLRRPARLAPVEQLNPALVLADGRVTCSTCHDANSPHPFHMAVSMDGSALCFACHTGY